MARAALIMLFSCTLLCCPSLANQDDASKSLALIFSDDFSRATSAGYNIEGPAEGFVIENGTLSISQGVKVSRAFDIYQSLLVEFDLRLPKEFAEKEVLDFAMCFSVDSLHFRCEISRYQYQPPGECWVAFEAVNEDGSTAWTNKSVSNLSDCEGHWRMACENGRLVVERDDHRLFKFFTAPRPLIAFSRLEIQSGGVPVRIESLACHGQKLSLADRDRLQAYANNENKIRLARAASAEQRHVEAISLWRQSVAGWPLSDERTASVAFIQMEAGLAEITSGNVTDGLSRLKIAWPSLSRATPADHPWHIAGEALLREAHQRLKGRTPVHDVLRVWDGDFTSMWKAWEDVSWQGKTSLETDMQHLRNRWRHISQLKEEDLVKLEQMQKQSALAQATFVQGDPKLALSQAQEAIRQLKLMLDRGSGFSFLEEELGDLITLSARCQFLLADLDLKELERKVSSAQEHWEKALPLEHAKRLIAEHNVACMDYLRGNWLQSASRLRKTWKQTKALLGEGAPESLETQTALGMLLIKFGEPSESEELRIDAMWQYAAMTTAGWLPIGIPTIEAFEIREELIEHPSLIMFFGAAAPAPPSFDPLAFHADSLTLARLAGRIDQLAPMLSLTPWNEPSSRAMRIIAELAPTSSPLRSMANWIGHDLVKVQSLPESHPWRVWLQRRDASRTLGANGPPPAAPVTALDEYRSASLQQLQSALQESIEVFGEDHPETAWCHEALSVAYYTLGRLDEANTHSAKSAEIFSKKLELKHYRTLAVTNTQGIVEFYRQNLKPAFEILQQNASYRREMLGDYHLETLRSLSDVAVVARSLGQYDLARRLIEQAIERWPESGDSLTPMADEKVREYRQIALVNRAVLQAESGDYASAESRFKELLEQADFPQQRHLILLSLSSLAITKGDFGSAEGYLLESQSLLSDLKSPRTDPQIDHSLGVVYRELGQLTRSREYLEKALQQRRENKFGAPYELGDTLTSLGILEQTEGNLGQALQVYREAAKSYVQHLGPMGLRQADSIRRVALAAHLKGEHQLALLSGESALKLKRQLVDSLAPSMSEAETLLFANTLTEHEPLLSALFVDHQKNAAVALQSVWQRKAIVTRLLERRRVRLQAATDPEVRQRTEQLRTVRSELATLLGPQFVSRMVIDRRPGKGNDVFDQSNRLQRIQLLTTRKERLERSLAGLAGNDERPLDTSLEVVAQGMNRNTALIEFVKVNIWPRADDDAVKANIKPDARYMVFVLHKDAANAIHLDWHDVGAVTEIDPLVIALRRFVQLEMRQLRGLTITDDEVSVLQNPSIYEQLSQKLSVHWIGLTSQCKHIYIVPDGMLHGLPWAAMAGNRTKYLIEETSISLLGSGPELLSRPRLKQIQPNFLLVGDVAYGQQPESSLRPNWQALKGTGNELLSIRNLVGDRFSVARLENDKATEVATIESMRTASVAHLATHGFFTPDRLVEASMGTSAWRDPMLASAIGRNPLSRCGVVLSDANHLPELDAIGIPHGSDGLLTGEELCDLDLRNVKLVVLSACETGLGQIADNEGTFGLHKALSRAGAEASIGSLWKVSDDATTQLMTEFYRNLLLQNDSVANALRKAQLRLLKENQGGGKSALSAPFFWAAFVVSGNADVRISSNTEVKP